MEGACDHYFDCFLQFRNIGSKRGNVKQPCLLEMHSEIGTLLHFLAHRGHNTGGIAIKFAVCIVYNICKRMERSQSRYLDCFLHFWGIGSRPGNVKPSYLIEMHSEIGTLFPILVHHGPNTGEIVMKFAAYIVYNICKRMGEGEQRPLSRLLLAFLGPSKQTR